MFEAIKNELLLLRKFILFIGLTACFLSRKIWKCFENRTHYSMKVYFLQEASQGVDRTLGQVIFKQLE